MYVKPQPVEIQQPEAKEEPGWLVGPWPRLEPEKPTDITETLDWGIALSERHT